jgi:hypothetical protein
MHSDSTVNPMTTVNSVEEVNNSDGIDDKPPDFAEDHVAGQWTLKVPILPCWDETDDGVPPVSSEPVFHVH